MHQIEQKRVMSFGQRSHQTSELVAWLIVPNRRVLSIPETNDFLGFFMHNIYQMVRKNNKIHPVKTMGQ